jgi:hypothetical protein
MDMDANCSILAIFIKANINKIGSMAMENIHGKTELLTKVILQMEKEMGEGDGNPIELGMIHI